MLEVVIGSGDTKVYALRHDGSLLWSYTTGYYVSSSPAVADINGDNMLEVVIGSGDNKVYALRHDGTLLWSYTTGGRIWGSPAVADINGDSMLEVVIGSLDSTVYALRHDGILLWSYNIGGAVHRAPSIADIDGDDNLEILVPNMDGNTLYCLNHDGSILWSIELAKDVHNITIADIDCDSCLELAVGIHGEYKLWVLDDVNNTSGCARATGINEDKEKTKAMWLKVIGLGNEIRFYIPKSGVVNLHLYDICGRLVKQVLNSVMNKGEHHVKLSFLPNGIYFVHLKYQGSNCISKITVIK
jgi:outer membrane protein assembly factor BamB